MQKRLLLGSCLVLGALAAPFASGCGGNGGDTSSSSSGSGGGAAVQDKCAADVDVTGCTTVVAPNADDTHHVQTALIDAKSGSTVCFCPGTYHFTQQLSLTVTNVTVRGAGKNIDDTVLDFGGSTNTSSGNDTMLVTADGFTIENMAIKNTPGNGVVVRQADKPTFRKLHVSWDGGPKAGNGAYAIYPAECTNVLVEDSEVEGAADAAIYVGQGTGAVIRRNKAHGSVLGIEFENTDNGEAYDNEIYDNAGGLAIFLLGNLTKKTSNKTLIYKNNIHDNNRMNFGDSKSFVASVPTGTGIIMVASDDVEIHDNQIINNESVGVMTVSYTLMEMLVPGAKHDPASDPTPERIFVHNNTFMNNGTKPQDPVSVIGVSPLENVVWDGIVPSGMPETNTTKFCLGTMGPYPSFRMFAADHLDDKSKQSTDTTPYQCDLPAIPPSGT